ncbi:MAG: anti-sigma factor family protein [Actinomycetota bacterium]
MSDHDRSSASTHPDELLAGLVDGTLTPAERAEVQSHLDACERCRGEVRMAESARRALGALPEVETRWGVGRAAVEEARSSRPERKLRRFAPAAGVAAAALLLVGVGFAVLHGPQNGGGASNAARPAGSAAPPNAQANGASAPLIRRVNRNYDAQGIEGLAARYSTSRDFGRGAFEPVPAPAPSAQEDGAGVASPARSAAPQSGPVQLSNEDAVVACVDSAAGLDRTVRPARVIVARFHEKPALIGIYLSGPGANQPADLLVVWVASRECQFLHYASHRISP